MGNRGGITGRKRGTKRGAAAAGGRETAGSDEADADHEAGGAEARAKAGLPLSDMGGARLLRRREGSLDKSIICDYHKLISDQSGFVNDRITLYRTILLLI
jgi:hypothetical protein